MFVKKELRTGRLRDLVEVIEGRVASVNSPKSPEHLPFQGKTIDAIKLMHMMKGIGADYIIELDDVSRDSSGVERITFDGEWATLRAGDQIRAYVLPVEPVPSTGEIVQGQGNVQIYRKRNLNPSEEAFKIERIHDETGHPAETYEKKIYLGKRVKFIEL